MNTSERMGKCPPLVTRAAAMPASRASTRPLHNRLPTTRSAVPANSGATKSLIQSGG
jgi:hypothetical protein